VEPSDARWSRVASDVDRSFPVRHSGELLGALGVSMPAAEPLTPPQERLVADLASQAGLILRNVRLIEELRASRHSGLCRPRMGSAAASNETSTTAPSSSS
jgi:tetrahydromethanopterin S-methyltransferase subunit F